MTAKLSADNPDIEACPDNDALMEMLFAVQHTDGMNSGIFQIRRFRGLIDEVLSLRSQLSLAITEKDEAVASVAVWKEAYEDVSTRASMLGSLTYARHQDVAGGLLAAITTHDKLTADILAAVSAHIAEHEGLRARVFDLENTRQNHLDTIDYWKTNTETAEARIRELEANQRTPGTVEVCSVCRKEPSGQNSDEWSACKFMKPDLRPVLCPIRSQGRA